MEKHEIHIQLRESLEQLKYEMMLSITLLYIDLFDMNNVVETASQRIGWDLSHSDVIQWSESLSKAYMEHHLVTDQLEQVSIIFERLQLLLPKMLNNTTN